MADEMFLLDANSFITPYLNYYSFDIASGYWKQLQSILLRNDVIVMDVVKNEIEKGEDDLTKWLSSIKTLEVLDRRDQMIFQKYREVLNFLRNSPLYNDKALRAWSDVNIADPWLIAAASARKYTLVTFEQSAGRISPVNPSGKPKIPDIAREFGVKCVNLFYFMKTMNLIWK